MNYLFRRANDDPGFEAEYLSKRSLRGPQAEIIKRVEAHVNGHKGGVMCIRSSRQSGKNDLAAILQRRHLWLNQLSPYKSSWIRTAPTHEPQIVNSKKRLEELIQLDRKNVAHHPLFLEKKIIKSEGYIWRGPGGFVTCLQIMGLSIHTESLTPYWQSWQRCEALQTATSYPQRQKCLSLSIISTKPVRGTPVAA